MTLTFNPGRAMVMMIHISKTQVQRTGGSNCVVDKRTDGRTDTDATDYVNFPPNAVGNHNNNSYRFLANVNSRSRSLYAIARPSVCRLSVTLVHPTQPVEIFGNFSSPSGTLAIH